MNMNKKLQPLIIALVGVISVIVLTFGLMATNVPCGGDLNILIWLLGSLVLLIVIPCVYTLLQWFLLNITGQSEGGETMLRKINLSCYSALITLSFARLLAVVFTKHLCGFAFSGLFFYSLVFIVLSVWAFAFSFHRKTAIK